MELTQKISFCVRWRHRRHLYFYFIIGQMEVRNIPVQTVLLNMLGARHAINFLYNIVVCLQPHKG